MALHRIDVDELIAQRRYAGAIDLTSRRRVMTDLAGSRVSGFRGRGMDFEEHRVYQPGDEARTIDWRVTARTGTTHVRLYCEERERPVLLAVDLSAPMWFGTRGCYKAVLAARAAALCAWAAEGNGDRVGGLVVQGRRHAEVRPAAGARGVLRLLHACGAAPVEPEAHDTALVEALQRLLRTARPGALVAVFSDFRGLAGAAHDLLVRIAQRAELIVGFVHDPLEAELPPAGVYPVAAPGGGAPLLLDTRPRAFRERWQAAFRARRDAAQEIARRHGAHWLELSTGAAPLDAITAAFGRRRAA